MKKIFATLLIVTAAGFSARAQNNVGINNASPVPSAALMVDTAANGPQGMLLPRMTLARRNAIAGPANGLLVYQTDNVPGIYSFNGTAWVPVSAGGGPLLQLYVTNTITQTKIMYAYSRYTYNFDNVVSNLSPGAWTGNNTFTVPQGMSGLYQINFSSVTVSFTGYSTLPVISPEIQVTSGSTIRYFYGVGSQVSTLLTGDNTDATSSISASQNQPPASFGRSVAGTIVQLSAGDIVRVFIRSHAAAINSGYTVSFSTDGSSYLSIVKMN